MGFIDHDEHRMVKGVKVVHFDLYGLVLVIVVFGYELKKVDFIGVFVVLEQKHLKDYDEEVKNFFKEKDSFKEGIFDDKSKGKSGDGLLIIKKKIKLRFKKILSKKMITIL